MTSGAIAKVSFRRLPLDLEPARLVADLEAIPTWAWERSHWPYPHGSVEQVLLRGGTRGTELDFFVDEGVIDHEVMARTPYLGWLVGGDGPFGGATFAFLFRMAPGGRSRLHTDDMPIWRSHHRVHVPIVTNPGARLVAGGRWIHLPVGQAWTFDNQSLHGAVNGDAPRTHLILDVPDERPAMRDLLARATFDPGEAAPPIEP
ncbi:MAG: aspartyl/asparaginyl beta-hydroxylase domain-containing protein [Deltaproteobacteria bacterium]|nr:aspartyl/asparaginyl beta-hydroxylase domain-containing protein [Deltaproteobacteria bacterium]